MFSLAKSSPSQWAYERDGGPRVDDGGDQRRTIHTVAKRPRRKTFQPADYYDA